MIRTIANRKLLFGCLLGAFVAVPAWAQSIPSVEIVVENLCRLSPPKVLVFYGSAIGLTPPLRFDWDLGNGKDWVGPEVPEQAYDVGHYDVILAVTDAAGKIRKASVAVVSESHGCGGR